MSANSNNNVNEAAASAPNAVGPVDSRYLANLMAKKSEYAFPEEQHRPTAVPSQYAAVGLENVVTLESNAVYQWAPISAKPRHILPGAGIPISAAQLKQKVAALEDKIYVPTILDGALFFVSNDDDTRTARSSASGTNLEEPTFTLAQLKEIFGQEIASKLASAAKGGQPLPPAMKEALVMLKTGSSNNGSQVSTAASNSFEQVVTPGSSLWGTPTKGVNTALSRTLLTGVDTLSEKTALSRSDLVLTARGSEPNLAAAPPQPLGSTTGVPTYLLTTTPSNNPQAHAARAVPSIDTMTAIEA